MTSTAPHYLRVARALALVSGLAGVSGCYASTTLEADSGTRATSDAGGALDGARPVDSGFEMADSGRAPDAAMADGGSVHPCETCTCEGWGPTDSGPDAVTCESIGHFDCCAVIGPLFPPDLAA